jgi:ribonuclease HI
LEANLARRIFGSTSSTASCHTAAVIEILKSSDLEREVEPASTDHATDDQYILYFDGGSRGNPGPGGSGAVIVKTSSQMTSASIIWSAAMSSAHPSTTDNQAEYVGVVAGLRAAHANNWTPLEVVGDSQLILGQLKNYRAPRNDRLHQLYAEARRLGDLLGARRWNHHLRSFNKMADAAANAAMDTKTSSQVHHPTTRVNMQRSWATLAPTLPIGKPNTSLDF